jgi:hypothetical protein
MTTPIADNLAVPRSSTSRSRTSLALRLLARLRGRPAPAPRGEHPSDACPERRADIDRLFARAMADDRFTDTSSR